LGWGLRYIIWISRR